MAVDTARGAADEAAWVLTATITAGQGDVAASARLAVAEVADALARTLPGDGAAVEVRLIDPDGGEQAQLRVELAHDFS